MSYKTSTLARTVKEMVKEYEQSYDIEFDESIGAIDLHRDLQQFESRDVPGKTDTDATPTKIETGFENIGPDQPTKI